MASVRVEGLRKAYRANLAVRGISFSVEDGEFFCLLGPPGAGKTTILRIISGLERPDEGEIYLGEEQVNQVPPAERDVAMVFEDLALYPHMTAYHNLAHPLRLHKVPRAEMDKTVREVAKMLHISHLLDRRPDTYSGGERRRVAVGRALVRRPRVLLLDQPLTDLDAWLRQEMTGELKRLQGETGQTMIYATHDFEEAVTMADRIMVLNLGEVEQLGSAEEVYKRPASVFVGGLVGSPSMNLIPCQAEGDEGAMVLSRKPLGLRIPVPHLPESVPRDLLLGIRPEHLRAKRGEATVLAASASLEATVDIVQPLGDEQIVDLRLKDGMVVKMVAPLLLELAPDDRVVVEFALQAVSLFEAESGRRIEVTLVGEPTEEKKEG